MRAEIIYMTHVDGSVLLSSNPGESECSCSRAREEIKISLKVLGATRPYDKFPYKDWNGV